MRSEDIRKRLKDIDEFLLNQYKESKKIEKRDWQTYEQQLMNRIKGAETQPSYVDRFGKAKVYVIPRKNATLRGSWRWFGWKVGQKRDDRINTALTCTGVWHNLLNLYPG